jgi:hypothetical protein
VCVPTALKSMIIGLVSSLKPADDLAQVRWWTAEELRHAGLDRFEPHLLRALDALGLGC